MFAEKVLYGRIAWSNIQILTRKSNPYSWHDNKWILVSHPVGEESKLRRGHQRLCQLMLEAVIGVRLPRPRHTRRCRCTPIQLRRPRRRPVPPISFDYHYYYYYCVANVLQPCCKKQLLPEENKKITKHATHTLYEWRLLLTVWRKQNKTEIKKLHALFWQEEKKIENETEKKTLLQLTTYVMCHKLNSDFSKLCLLSWPDALEFWRKIKKQMNKAIKNLPKCHRKLIIAIW